MNNQGSFDKFKKLLDKLFQFDSSDLDFGIYRIINHKRRQIKNFIEKDLKEKIDKAFDKHKNERLENIKQKFEEVKGKVVQTLGSDAFVNSEDLREEFKNTPVGKDFIDIKAQKEEAEAIDEIKDSVFNDLYNFFSRYYEEGDFIPQYRYSIKGHRYAIPYNGEEVKLYWVNQDQYYIKTGLLFRDYALKAERYKVIFRTVLAKEELGSNKATKQRFFILDDENPIEGKDSEIIVRFQYRELFEGEDIVKIYKQKFKDNANIEDESEEESNNNKGKKIKQEKLNEIIRDQIIEKLKDNVLKLLLQKEYKKDSKGNPVSVLDYHLNRFTAKNTKDYFIHKNLKKFLSEQLDYFIKSEVLNIETIEKEKFLDKHITRAKVVREISEEIIDFLSQIENFQKRLWEKKKFVIKTEYVITTDRIPEEFYDEIWKNEKQKKEWEELGFEIPKEKEDLKNSKLPIDTKYFPSEFKEKLLEKLTEEKDLDNLLDGFLIKSENWQALNTILNKYKGSIKTIYIDPPYNTGNDEFLYRDRYQHSSWLSMMENRLSLARELLSDDGVIFISIDDNEVHHLRMIMDEIFGEENFVANFIWRKKRGHGRGDNFVIPQTEYILNYAKNQKLLFGYRQPLSEEKLKYYKYKDEKGFYARETLEHHTPKGAYVRKTLQYDLIIDGKKIFCTTGQWLWKKDRVLDEWEKGNIDLEQDREGRWRAYKKIYLQINNEKRKEVPISLIDEPSITNNIATIELKDILGGSYYDFPKSTALIKRLILFSTGIKDDIILDFFAGSGTTAHAVMKLNKEDGGKRKFLLVEMADYFDTIIIPRIKKVAYSFNWKDGKPQDKDGIGVFFKYQYLEQYEDSLDNIELKENQKAQELFKDEYLIKYFLDFETKDSQYLLNIEHLKNPFAYKLKVNLSEVGEPQEVIVDIPETFNYLLGIKLKKIKKRKNNGKDYLFILGEKEGQTYAIVWRELSCNKEDVEKDKVFIKKELKDWKPQIVYVNCPENTISTPDFEEFQAEIRYIEIEFKRLMERTV